MDEFEENLKEPYEAPDISDISPVTVALGWGDSDEIFDPDEGDGDF